MPVLGPPACIYSQPYLSLCKPPQPILAHVMPPGSSARLGNVPSGGAVRFWWAVVQCKSGEKASRTDIQQVKRSAMSFSSVRCNPVRQRTSHSFPNRLVSVRGVARPMTKAEFAYAFCRIHQLTKPLSFERISLCKSTSPNSVPQSRLHSTQLQSCVLPLRGTLDLCHCHGSGLMLAILHVVVACKL